MPIDYYVGSSKEKEKSVNLQQSWKHGSNETLKSTALDTLHVSAQLSSELVLKTLCNKMDSGDTAIGQKATSRSGETAKVPSRWRQDDSAVIKMSTFGNQDVQRQPQIDHEQIRNTASAQLFSSGKLVSSSEAAQQVTEEQYPQHRPSPYSCQHSLSFPQHSLPQGYLHNIKPHQSLESHTWQFPGHLQSVASEDLFPFHIHGHSGGFSRKKISSLNPAYSQYSQKSVEQSEDAHKKEHKPKKPGKYICPYCNRACAKPSVLKKHIRSHTGERPYPCVPCGFSFKTKSNLYKHRKSHAHAIKAGLVPFTESAVSKLDLDASFIDVEPEIHSDCEQSTDTDEEALLVEGSDKLSPVPPVPLDLAARGSFHSSMEESLSSPMKVPILIIPKSGIQVPSESSPYVGSDMLQNPALCTRSDDSHTVKQRLALRLSEKKGQDSEQSLNLLSPHSKGSTDSGYFSRSESAEQQVSPPNTNAKSYEEIIFGKFYRINQRTALTVATSNQEHSLMGRKGKAEPLPLGSNRLDIKMLEEHISQLPPNKEELLDPSQLSTIKSNQVFGVSNTESKQSQTTTSSIKSEATLYPVSQQAGTPGLLEPPVDASPLIRSNSMPTSSATNLSIPPSLRGSHSFDERMTGSDDVFYPGTVGISHQRMLRRQAAFELPSVQEGHSDADYHGRAGKNIIVASSRLTVGEKGPSLKEKKLTSGEKTFYDYDTCGKHYRKWEEFEAQKQSYRDSPTLGGIKQGGDYFVDSLGQSQVMPSIYGTTFENRKRRKEKSVGDEEDIPMLCSSSTGISLGMQPSDYDLKLQMQEVSRSGYVLQGLDSAVHCHSDRFEIGRPHLQSGSPAASLEEPSLPTEQEKCTESLNRKLPGNVISVIQHTNSLSRPNSFERSESTEHIACQQDKTYSPSEACESEISESPMSPDRVPQTENVDSKPSPTQQTQACHMQPRLVRQHNIQVPEIRVTEEPDKPEKEKEAQSKEQERPTEEFQWPQRSETLSQLPAEKLPPKKKRLRLADMEHSSGESSFESTGTSLSRSPSQESNLSHSSSFSMSFEREENIKFITPSKQEEFGKQSEFLTVPAGAYSLSVPGHHHQKEMRRCSSEQMPCPHTAEIPEIRSKSFDYGNLSHASAAGAPSTALSPSRERKKCFLVRQASFSGFPETSQTDQSVEQNIKQEQMEHMHAGLRSSQVAWHHSPSSMLQPIQSDDSGKQAVGSCAQFSNSSSHLAQQQAILADSQEMLRNPLIQQAPYIPSKHPAEQQHLFAHQEKVPFPTLHNTLFQFPYPAVCMVHLPSQPPLLWQSSEPLQRHFQHHFVQQLQKSYVKPPFQTEVSPGYHLEHAQEHIGKKPADYIHAKEQTYQHYSGTPGQYSKNTLAKYQPDHRIKSADTSSEQHLQTGFDSSNDGSVQSLPGTVVPVRIQTHVPSYGSVMYTSISQVLAQSNSPAIVICKVDETVSQRTLATNAAMQGIGFNIAQMLGQHGGLEKYPLWKVPQTLPLGLESSIPLCLTSSSDTASNLGGSKRMLSPASSLELFMETKQQKRVKEEKMYGQIVEELSAVELTNSDIKKDFPRPQKPQLVRQSCATEPKENLPSTSSSLPLSSSSSQDFQSVSLPTGDAFPLGREKISSFDSASPGQKSSGPSEGRESPEELDVDETASDMSMSPQRSMLPLGDIQTEDQLKQQKLPFGMLVQMASSPSGKATGSTILLTDVADFQHIFQFPSLRTTTTVSWCFLNYTKPNYIQQATLKSSVYASWCISSCNPNPSGLSTKTTLALLRSKQKNTTEIYTLAAMHRPGAGKLTSSSAWKQFAQVKHEPFFLFGSKLEKKVVGNIIKERVKGESHGDKDIASKQTEPIRIKIFEGGYKSNEDYVYVRGRGRGKYICEECGIRCKKPSMLKKHIRTHTDVRPYVCKLCNFAFKTKGNLTKHMKSKAHMKKCLELGVSMTSVDDAETEEAENMEDMHQETEKSSNVASISSEHQFSDAEESDGEDGDDNDDDDEEEDDFDDTQGDSTPKTRSRSTSPQPPRFSSLSVNSAAASQGVSSDSSISVGHTSLISYLVTLPSIQVTQLITPSDSCEDSQMTEYQRFFQNKSTDSEPDKDRLDIPSCMDEDYMLSLDPSSSPRDLSPSSHQSSPGYDSSPYRDNSPKRYLMPKGDLSPRRHLSPRRDISPMRHLSPRKEAVLRRELSPRRDVSPRRHLSPRRPMSPGKDTSARRDLSPRRERRYMASVRAASPRRGLYHNPALSMGQYLQSESVPLGHGRRGLSQGPYFNVYGEKGVPEHHGSSLFPEGPNDYIFSHLPLHSQQQIRAPIPMMPIGGIQMVHSVPVALSGLHPPSTLTLQREGSDEKQRLTSETLTKESYSISKHHEKRTSPHNASSGVSSSSLLLLKQSTSEDGLVATEREQEENIQTCTKAIASLRIATEEAVLHGVEQPQRASEPHQKPLESAHFSIKHFSGSEPGQPCASATHPDLHGGEKDIFGTSQTALAHSTFYNKSFVDVRQLGFHSRKESPSSTQERKDPSSEKSKLH
ncbi:transcription factor HIVEP2 isoform X1 [Alligator sinensis]|uniref:Transcription factor HIVEP2 isoform X1 n=2 Tax=Alligator sinensis TaxID=38654 RepID=A0A1U8DIC8_ALLSI|nr:transcription factor HIVEP2 isoform X1 [Alligator sinensis]XP_025047241.1 transcription factor HIVEP2 isoform X1 [Alligator sinensis]XP_025047242.1 transcription factor HIVEP2 isoform X1 [Alligator sinensis]XP_025047244.1 transcription factor HIVEP2 isoform X1 [Alligator sinensis]XP_025047245.1 transcription factor HIVEP2 isoform X1 [Alligator sinensis]XP_025047246.1 transcription factor HIVEP2 isoform X1 [Alligator sinensis]XP_025047247.1 transcription factor HIVEP2 isoform X1 [Alligator 